MDLPFDLIVFDVDNTLVDFDRGETAALAAVFNNFDIPTADGDLPAYRAINQQLWQQYSAGTLGKAEVLRSRFEQLFRMKGIDRDPEAANECFLENLIAEVHLLDGALEILTELHQSVTLGLITNGHGPTQRRRLACAGISHLFAFTLISDEFGRPKPDPAIFLEALRLSGCAPETSLMVGDCLTNDISGAGQTGFKTCWLRRPGETLAPDSPGPDWIIDSLRELKGLLRHRTDQKPFIQDT